jgi:hypothetical protein
MFADEFWMSRPRVDSDSKVLIVSSGTNVPVKESHEGQLRFLWNLDNWMVPIPGVDLPIYRKRFVVAAWRRSGSSATMVGSLLYVRCLHIERMI